MPANSLNNTSVAPDVQYRTYKDLIVYQKAVDVTVKIVDYYSTHKIAQTEKILLVQLIRAASSVGANLAEGYGRMHKKEYRRFVGIARGSSFEVEYWLDLLVRLSPQDTKTLSVITQINFEIIKMLTRMMKNLEE